MRAWTLLLVLACGCGPRGPTMHPVDPTKPIDKVVMEPMVLEAKKVGDSFEVVAYDAALLFDEAFALYQEGQSAEAAGIYERVLEEFPATELGPPAKFNLGLCMEKQGELDDAASIYDELIDDYPGTEASLHAMFRRGYCLEGLSLYDEAISQYEEILAMGDVLDGEDTLEAMSRIGHVLMLEGKDAEALDALTMAIQYYVTQSELERFENAYYAAQAQYDLAELARMAFEAVTFGTDEAEIREALDIKLGHMVEASDAYVQVIKIGNYYWAAASGYQVGQLLRTLFDHMMAAPVPPELDTEELVETYYDYLHEYIRPLLERAVSIWEKTLLMAERVDIDCEWVKILEEKLAETRGMLAQDLLGEGGEDQDQEMVAPEVP